VAQRVFFHIGAPKTGTTYIQEVLRRNRERLRGQGILIPRGEQRDFAWASNVVREAPNRPHEAARTAWQRIVSEVGAFDGSAVISHEFFAAATQQQAGKAIAELAPADVHVVYTARDYVQQIPAIWQELLKFRMTTPLAEFEPEPVTAGTETHFGWRSLDVVDALERWSHALPREHVHVVTVPPKGSPRELLWQRFASVCGIDPDSCDTGAAFANSSLGVVESEVLRRVNPRLSPVIIGPKEVPRWVRDYLAHTVLLPQGGKGLGLSVERADQLRARSRRAVEELREAQYDVVGDLEELIAPEVSKPARQPEEATDAELLDVALEAIATMVLNYREVTLERDRLRRKLRRLEQGHASEPSEQPVLADPLHTARPWSLLGRALRSVHRR
jgi:hypothetical protein